MDLRDELIPTSETLLRRVRNRDDQEAWQIFFDTYSALIYHTALKAGLTEAEAKDVLQETLLGLSKALPHFEYHRDNGSFKSWLLKLTSWKISRELRRRLPGGAKEMRRSTETSTLGRIPDPTSLDLEARWDEQWKENLLEAASLRIRKKADPAMFQMFDLSTSKGWSIDKISQKFVVSPDTVYLAKHRIGRLIADEVKHLQSRQKIEQLLVTGPCV
jgi:RNA polymerase sigma factor (sigma-70 family)